LCFLHYVGVQLDAKTKEIEWNPEKNFPKEDKEDGMPIPRHSLMIKQAILSHEAAEGEMAVIEAEAVGYAQSNIKTLISVLVQGKDHQRSLDLVFHDAPVKLRLIKGSGPVHLVGAHGVGMCYNSQVSCFETNFIFVTAYRYMGEDDSSDDEDGMGEEMDDEDEEEVEDIKPPTKKIKKEEPPAKGSPAKRGGKK
jgi:nucleophosmin 3